jgi:hypothetical protein
VNVLDCRVKRFRKHVVSVEAPSASQSIILKLKCNNLIFNEILVCMLCMCVCMHPRFVENHLI